MCWGVAVAYPWNYEPASNWLVRLLLSARKQFGGQTTAVINLIPRTQTTGTQLPRFTLVEWIFCSETKDIAQVQLDSGAGAPVWLRTTSNGASTGG